MFFFGAHLIGFVNPGLKMGYFIFRCARVGIMKIKSRKFLGVFPKRLSFALSDFWRIL